LILKKLCEIAFPYQLINFRLLNEADNYANFASKHCFQCLKITLNKSNILKHFIVQE